MILNDYGNLQVVPETNFSIDQGSRRGFGPHPPQPFGGNNFNPHPPSGTGGNGFSPHPPQPFGGNNFAPHPPQPFNGNNFGPHPPQPNNIVAAPAPLSQRIIRVFEQFWGGVPTVNYTALPPWMLGE